MHNRYALRMSCFRIVVEKALAICLALCLGIIPALPGDKVDIVPLGNWAAVESLQKGTSISVRMTSGDRMDGKFQGLDAESIHLMMNKQERIFPRNSIAEVWQLRVPDRKRNGALIGMGAGALAGGIGAAASGARFSGEDQYGVLLVAIGAGLGAIVGATTDAMIKGNRLLYRK